MQYALYQTSIARVCAGKLPIISRSIRRIVTLSILYSVLVSGVIAAFGFFNLAVAGSTPLVLYTFNEGNGNTVYDVSGTGEPLNLTVSDPSAVSWNSNGSLTINAPTIIASSTAAAKVSDAIIASKEVTIEAWVQPSSAMQDGPARIFTLSKNTRKRNLTLGQKQASYIVRQRTTKTDTNGKPQVSSPTGTLSTELTHVVYRRNAKGVVKLYINGVKQNRTTVGGNFSNWNSSYKLALGNELSGGQPWLGTFYKIAVYDYAFSATEVSQAYATGNSVTADVSTNTVTQDVGVANTVPVAVNDSVSVTGPNDVTIDPLANDSRLMDTPITLSIISGPTHGSAYVIGTKILYQPASSDFTGTDTVTYQIMDADGDRATATVSIKVTCSLCASISNKTISMSWNPSAGGVLGYYVYYGASATAATNYASVVAGTETTFTTFASDLNLQVGEQVCFRVKAYNSAGESPFSSAVCSTV